MADCPICLEKFTAEEAHIPRMLPCGHTLCHTCLNGLPTMVCPIDDKVVRVPDTGIEGLPRNYALLQAINTMENTAPPHCDECDTPTDATVWCIGCATHLCEEHADSMHQHRSLQQHRCVPLDQEAPLCPQHPRYALDAYCRTHGVLLCERCINPVYGTVHVPERGVHDVVPVETAVESITMDLTRIQREVREQREVFIKEGEDLQVGLEKVQEAESEVVEAINVEFDRLHEAFHRACEERREHILKHIIMENTKHSEVLRKRLRVVDMMERQADWVLEGMESGLAAGGVRLVESWTGLQPVITSIAAHQPATPLLHDGKVCVEFENIDVTVAIGQHGHTTSLEPPFLPQHTPSDHVRAPGLSSTPPPQSLVEEVSRTDSSTPQTPTTSVTPQASSNTHSSDGPNIGPPSLSDPPPMMMRLRLCPSEMVNCGGNWAVHHVLSLNKQGKEVQLEPGSVTASESLGGYPVENILKPSNEYWVAPMGSQTNSWIEVVVEQFTTGLVLYNFNHDFNSPTSVTVSRRRVDDNDAFVRAPVPAASTSCGTYNARVAHLHVI